jgi:hypothetical protein
MKFNTGFKVVMFGSSEYKNNEFIPIPNVNANLEHLSKVLQDESIIGIPEENIKIFRNLNEVELKEQLDNLASETNRNETLLVYFSGHGVFSSSNFELYLTGFDTHSDKVHVNGLSIVKFKEFVSKAKNSRKFVILDCCYSGEIHRGAMNKSFENHLLAQIKRYQGTFTITSSSRDQVSLYPPDKPQEPTFFTGKLIEYLKTGINNNNQYVTMQELFSAIKSDFEQQGLPVPQSSSFNNTNELPFALNKAWLGVDESEQLEIINRNISPVNPVFLFHSPESGATTFIGSLIKTVQNSADIRLRLFSETNQVLDYFENHIAKFIDKNRYPEKGETGKATEFDLGISRDKTDTTLRFSLLDTCGTDSWKILEYKKKSTVLSYYLMHSKHIVIMTSVNQAATDDLKISGFFEILHQLKLKTPVELIISKWDEIEQNFSLNDFIESRMPNTSKWLSTKEFNKVNVFNFSILLNNPKEFELKNNTYAKQFINRLWENLTQSEVNLFNTGILKKPENNINIDTKKLNNLLMGSRIKEVFSTLLKSNLPLREEKELKLLYSNWTDLIDKERADLISGEKLIQKKTAIKTKLLKYINDN